MVTVSGNEQTKSVFKIDLPKTGELRPKCLQILQYAVKNGILLKKCIYFHFKYSRTRIRRTPWGNKNLYELTKVRLIPIQYNLVNAYNMGQRNLYLLTNNSY